MIFNEKLIYLQMQKTGCSHIANLILQTVGGKRKGKHNILTDYNTGKYIVGSVRNPWDWYVSLWAFGCSGRGAVRDYLTKNINTKDIKHPVRLLVKLVNPTPVQFFKKTYSDVNDPALFRTWLRSIYDSRSKMYLREGYADHPISNFCGFMTYRYCRLYLKNFYKPRIKETLKNIDCLKKYDEKIVY